jgi:hypothetical protein
VLDDDTLPERSLQSLRGDAGQNIGRPSGTSGHDEFDHFLRIVLSVTFPGRDQAQGTRRNAIQKHSFRDHDVLLAKAFAPASVCIVLDIDLVIKFYFSMQA